MKKMTMTVTTNDDLQDVFRLKYKPDQGIDVVLTGNSGTSDLQKLFSHLLEELFEDDIEIEFEKTVEYSTGLYEEVCKEYIQVLNDELSKARKKMIEEGLTHASLGSAENIDNNVEESLFGK